MFLGLTFAITVLHVSNTTTSAIINETFFLSKKWRVLWWRNRGEQNPNNLLRELANGKFMTLWKTARLTLVPVSLRLVNFPLQKLLGELVQAFGATISGIVWVDKRYCWSVNSWLEYHRPIITNACPTKRFQKSLYPKLVAILPIVYEVGISENETAEECLKCRPERLDRL